MNEFCPGAGKSTVDPSNVLSVVGFSSPFSLHKVHRRVLSAICCRFPAAYVDAGLLGDLSYPTLLA